MKYIKLITIISTLIISLFSYSVVYATGQIGCAKDPTLCPDGSACNTQTGACVPLQCVAGQGSVCPDGSSCSSSGQCLPNDTGTVTTTPGQIDISSPFGISFDKVLSNVIQNITLLFLFLVGLVLLVMIGYAGFLYLVDAGNEENAKKANKIITSAVIGIAIIGLTGFIIAAVEGIFGINLGLTLHP